MPEPIEETAPVEGVVTDQGPTEAPADEPNLPEAMLDFARMDAFVDAVMDYMSAHRPAMFAQLLAEAKRSGAKSFNVNTGDDTTVASMTITKPKDKVVVDDPVALVKWAIDVFPSEVVSEPALRAPFKAALTTKYVDAGPAGVFLKDISIAPRDAVGQEVPGLKYVPAGDPKSFSVNWKGDDLKAGVLAEVMEKVGPILGITDGTTK